jgi:two-component system cell cycle response regulator CpdR
VEGKGYYVLLVDDDAQLRRLFTSALTSWGYEVHAVGTGEEGIDELTRRCPDVLIADLIMPGMSGEEVARRASALCPEVRLVFVSGYAGADLRDFGVTQVVYLPKPIAMTTFRATLQRVIAR